MMYAIKFKMAGHWVACWMKGDDMESTLKQAKKDIKRIFGRVGSVCIYNPDHL